MKTHTLNVVAVLLAAAALGGCGGGGGSDAGLSLSTPYAVAAGYRNLLGATRDVTLTGPGSDGDPYSVRITLQPIAGAVFPVGNVSAARTRQVLTLTNTRTRVTNSITADGYYDAATATPIGSVDDMGSCTRINSFKALPASATVGTSDTLSTEVDLASCTAGAAETASLSNRWSLEAGTGGFALLCQNTNIPASSTAPTTLFSVCFEIAADGSLGNRARFYTKISTLPLFELTATNY